MNIQRVAAFSDGTRGGNPAGVVLLDALPSPDVMQETAAFVGYSETAFACPEGDAWRVRYFAPATEVDFCGHATIALGAVLAADHGDGTYALRLNRANITVQAEAAEGRMSAALQSPPTHSAPALATLVAATLSLFGLDEDMLDGRIPPAFANAGANHLILALRDRATLAAMRYDQAAGRVLAVAEGIATFSLVHAETTSRFHVRNPFPIGGIYEDPATGAAAAALAGYLRDQGWPHGGTLEILQGQDMGMPSRVRATLTAEAGSSIRVSGAARRLAI